MFKDFDRIYKSKIRIKIKGPYLAASLIMIVMPVYHWYLPPFMILWIILLLVGVATGTALLKNINPLHKFLFLLFILFYLWQICGMLYSDNPREGWRNIELHLSLLIFPIVMLFPGEMIRNKVSELLKIFSLSTFAFILFCFAFALYRSLSICNGNLVFNPYLPEYTWLNYFYTMEFAIFQHPSYLSMFTLLSFYIALENVFGISGTKKYLYLWLIISVILMMSVYFLSSRAGILAAILTLPVYLYLKFRQIGKVTHFWVSILLMTLIVVPIVLTNPRVNNYQDWREKHKNNQSEVSNDRMIIWNAVSTILGQNLILGVGTGDIQDELNNKFRSKGHTKLAEVNTNTHNQYLEILIENGLIGLIIFLSMIVMMLYIAYKGRNILYLMFLLIVVISFLFETMINRLAGVSFFSLFSFMLIIAECKNCNVPTDEK